MERTPPKDHEDHVAEKGFNSSSHYNLVHKFILVLQAMKVPDAKAPVSKEWEKLEKLQVWQMTKRAKNSPFCHATGHLSSQKCGVGTEVSEIQRPGRAPR